MQMIGRAIEQVLEVPTAFEVDECEAHRSVRHLPCDAHDVVTHAEALGVALHLRGDLGREWDEEQLGQKHQLDDPGPELVVAKPQGVGELVRAEWLDVGDVDDKTGHRRG